MNEREAIVRLKTGHIDGLEPLVRAHQLRALRAAYLVTGDHALAEDVVQEAFLRLMQRIQGFDDQRPFAPWFLRSVVNDVVKAATRRKVYASTNDYGDGKRIIESNTRRTIWIVFDFWLAIRRFFATKRLLDSRR